MQIPLKNTCTFENKSNNEVLLTLEVLPPGASSEMDTTMFIGKTNSKPRSSSERQSVPLLLHPSCTTFLSTFTNTEFQLGDPPSHLATFLLRTYIVLGAPQCRRTQNVELHSLPPQESTHCSRSEGWADQNNCSGSREQRGYWSKGAQERATKL